MLLPPGATTGPGSRNGIMALRCSLPGSAVAAAWWALPSLAGKKVGSQLLGARHHHLRFPAVSLMFRILGGLFIASRSKISTHRWVVVSASGFVFLLLRYYIFFRNGTDHLCPIARRVVDCYGDHTQFHADDEIFGGSGICFFFVSKLVRTRMSSVSCCLFYFLGSWMVECGTRLAASATVVNNA